MLKLNKKLLIFSILVIFIQAKTGRSSDNSPKWQEEDFIYTTSKGGKVVNHHKIIGMDKIPSSLLGEGCKIAIVDVGWFNCKSDVEHALTEETQRRLGGLSLEEKEKNHYQFGHANMVSSVIAGKNGIVPKATLEVFTCSNDEDLKDEDVILECAENINQAIESKVDFINMSIGWGEIGCHFPEMIEQALYKARDAKIGVILAASNDSNIVNTISLGQTMYIGIDKVLNNMQGYMRIATASQYSSENNKAKEYITNFSNSLSGECADYGLTAPGQEILSHDPYGEEIIVNGTSFSAPIITASAALLKSTYKDLGSNEILGLLDQGARKTKLNCISREEYKINMLKKEFNSEFHRYCTRHSIGRGGRIIYSDRPNPHFENYIDSSYNHSYGLFKYHFGQGVIDIAKALQLKSE